MAFLFHNHIIATLYYKFPFIFTLLFYLLMSYSCTDKAWGLGFPLVTMACLLFDVIIVFHAIVFLVSSQTISPISNTCLTNYPHYRLNDNKRAFDNHRIWVDNRQIITKINISAHDYLIVTRQCCLYHCPYISQLIYHLESLSH